MVRNNKRIKVLIALTLAAGMFVGCTSNGDAKDKGSKSASEVVVEYKGGSATKDEVFKEMAKTAGLNVTLLKADKGILESLYKDNTDIEEKISNKVSQLEEKYGDQLIDVLKKNGFESVEEYKEMIRINLQREKYIVQYIEENMLEEDQIKAYYDNYEAKIKASHILIPTQGLDDAGKAEAKKTAEDIITKLNNGEDFAKLAKEFSRDPGSAVKGGDLGYFSKGQMVPSFEEAAYNLKVNEYTKQPVESQFGYHIILKTDEENKGTIEEMRKEIVEALALQIVQKDNTLGDKALIKMREDNGLKFMDETLKELYNDFVKTINGEEEKEK